uniref:Uncharacterized protein n=1 Tax=Fagus sylvatica TaxID=28930 RepID=A0A2N9ERH4_FAGSY
MEGDHHNEGTSNNPPLTPIERQMQVIATSIQDLARETSRQNQELRQAIRKGPPTPHDNNLPPPQEENGSNDQEADSRQKAAKTTRSSKQPDRPDRSSKQPELSDRSNKRPDQPDHLSRQLNHLARSSKDPDDKTACLEEELREMRKQMGDMKNNLKAKAARNLDNLVHRADSLFIPSIANFPIPSRFKLPLLENFNGTKDPFDYLEAFKTIMQLQAIPEEIMCRAFPIGLRGSARVWFNKLKSESIGSFVHLSRAFIDHFIGSQRRGRPPTHFLSVKQMEGESLRAYVHRFNEEAMKINLPKEDVTVTAFMAGLRKGDFLYDLCKDPPETLSELMYEVQKHMNAEDALEAMDNPPPKRRKDIEDHKFHRDHRHLTEDCMALKEQVETLIRIRPGPIGEIRTIVGRPASGGTSRASRKAYARQTSNDRQRKLSRYTLPSSLSTDEARQRQAATHGRTTRRIHRRQAVTSTYHLLLKFPTEHGIGEVRGDQVTARECYLASLGSEGQNQTMTIEERKITVKPSEELDMVKLEDEHPERTTRIGADLSPRMKESLIQFLKNNKDVFAWSHEDMPGIDPSIISHKLNVNPSLRPVKQKRRVFAPERNNAIMEEVDKLLTANFIMEVFYPDWLANVVMVKKNTGKWRMCVDFTDPNKACPKDSFPLPRIDQLIDSTAGHKILTFMDAFSGYNQIVMDESDQEKTSFITSRGLFCYKVMPFGLKNAGATYQRLMNRMFHDQIGRNVEVYVDDMLVKSKEEDDHLEDLRETFETLRKYQMKLNPSKCAFGVYSGKFLGFMVSQRGIEANPDKIKAILEMQPPKTTKEIQRLTGRVATLNRFVSRSTDKCLPFFKTLKKAFTWTNECQQAFEELKSRQFGTHSRRRWTTTTRLLHKSSAQRSRGKISTHGVLRPQPSHIRGRESVCFREREKGNPFMEKLAFALVTAARKLRPYFQAHIVIVLTNHPLRKAMNKPDATGRLIQWSVELSEFDIDYRSRSAIKAQALADFIVEFTNKDDEPVETEENKAPRWTVHTDGSSTKNAGRVRIIIRSPEGDVIKRAIRLQYTTTNNKAEYGALLAGLKTAKTLGATELNVHSDSFHEVKLTRIPREQNTAADQLARSVSSSKPNEELEVVRHSSLQTIEVNPVETKTSWMTPIISYLERGTLPDNRHDARRIKVRASRFTILQGTLYKKGFSLPYLRCLTPAEAEYVLREIHEGICGNHSGTQSLAKKVVRAGYYWPSIQADADLLVRHYDKCQRFANLHHSPSEELTPMTSPWPFAQWGLDIMGPLPIGRHQLRFVAVICRFGIPRVLVSDNGKQFDNPKFRQFSEELGIHNHYSSPGHPQANGQVEVTNRSLLKLIKTRLEGAKGQNDTHIRLNLDLIDEVREQAMGRMKRYQEKMTRHHNAKVKARRFEIGDLVLRKVTPATKDPTQGKLGPNWEGPYRVIEIHRRGTYHLENMDGGRLPHPWNIEHLKKYYP